MVYFGIWEIIQACKSTPRRVLSWVRLFKLKEPLDWHELDAYEDFHPNDLAGSLYLRIETQVLLANDKPQRAWVYHYQGPMHFAKVIEHGDYALHRQTLRLPRR
ncbi:gamma-glutamylcyclotransferase [Pseudoalteromonas xiamenensis]|uniref:gamma-glutamylcyclotransferase n=1 Tax=Pseudoalteromonas xiamenensis TaxID=882626 RepID=UPI003CC6EFEC